MFRFDHRVSRPVTSELLDMAEQGVIDWETLARDALGWMSEHEVEQFARRNDYIRDTEEDL
jgi:predicted metal-dependent peptidase